MQQATVAAARYSHGARCTVVSAAEIATSGPLFSAGDSDQAVTPGTFSGSFQDKTFVYWREESGDILQHKYKIDLPKLNIFL